jgi:ApbE superfamily uncharacterized protein (UPF0280 family)
MFEPRLYRNWVKNQDLVCFNVIVEESDCYISASANLERKAFQAIRKYRAILQKYIASHPLFLTTLEPFQTEAQAPLIVKDMAQCGARAGVGPMAAVAGAIAQFCARDLSKFTSDLIIENGGDIYLQSRSAACWVFLPANRRLVGKSVLKSPPAILHWESALLPERSDIPSVLAKPMPW